MWKLSSASGLNLKEFKYLLELLITDFDIISNLYTPFNLSNDNEFLPNTLCYRYLLWDIPFTNIFACHNKQKLQVGVYRFYIIRRQLLHCKLQNDFIFTFTALETATNRFSSSRKKKR
jgi:hypothetical protein